MECVVYVLDSHRILLTCIFSDSHKPHLLPSRTPTTVTWGHFLAFMLSTILLVWSCMRVDILSVILRLSAGSSVKETVFGLLLVIFEISAVVGQFVIYSNASDNLY